MTDMTFEQKSAALEALSPIAVMFRAPAMRVGRGDPWYVQQSVEVADGRGLVGKYGNGSTPEAAILDHWRVLVDELPTHMWLVIEAFSPQRKAVRWNGFMWADYAEPRP